MSHWCIIEPNLTGHRVKYLQEFAQAALAAGHRVSVALAERPSNHEVLAADILPRSPQINYHYCDMPADHDRFGGLVNDLRREFAYWRFARQAYRSIHRAHAVDALLFPYFDYCVNVCGLIGPPADQAPIYGVVMRPTFHFAAMGVKAPVRRFTAVRQCLFMQALKHPTIRGVMAIDRTLHEFALKQTQPQWKKVRYMPDPAERHGHVDRSIARQQLGLPSGARVLLAYGALDDRKGLLDLFQSLNHPATPQDLCVVLAGRLSDKLRVQLQTPVLRAWQASGRLQLHDRRIADAEEPVFFGAADAVWLGYKGHYTMSGVLLKAGRFGRQVLAGEDGLIAWFASRMPNAIAIGRAQPEEVAHALSQIEPAPEHQATDGFPDHEWSHAIQIALPELLNPAPPQRPMPAAKT